MSVTGSILSRLSLHDLLEQVGQDVGQQGQQLADKNVVQFIATADQTAVFCVQDATVTLSHTHHCSCSNHLDYGICAHTIAVN